MTSDVQNLITGGAIELNNTVQTNTSAFNITSNGGVVTLSLVGAVPEPSSVALSALGGAALLGWAIRRKRAATV